mmetsp:Transcript_66354/g.158749  ORF Transcript_66354/g.158749 Transcript_66354/m.158749 type:complete len:382 (-) Transcript_66354:76-1221(-)|eukprot:CAMPEP_0178400672 /NCGR_PEP_ID=MMETSP0689_2-20121128/15910_1 /TAXON_ID=160604 /ORGANISM="Amphidinium massartii, Strain CS-259" /LENGTH=381 /DNA_ID=CAMNT_0020021475 /DNA_START=73 /DNA_END=1218 /DNA_ORIENTATION=+
MAQQCHRGVPQSLVALVCIIALNNSFCCADILDYTSGDEGACFSLLQTEVVVAGGSARTSEVCKSPYAHTTGECLPRRRGGVEEEHLKVSSLAARHVTRDAVAVSLLLLLGGRSAINSLDLASTSPLIEGLCEVSALLRLVAVAMICMQCTPIAVPALVMGVLMCAVGMCISHFDYRRHNGIVQKDHEMEIMDAHFQPLFPLYALLVCGAHVLLAAAGAEDLVLLQSFAWSFSTSSLALAFLMLAPLVAESWKENVAGAGRAVALLVLPRTLSVLSGAEEGIADSLRLQLLLALIGFFSGHCLMQFILTGGKIRLPHCAFLCTMPEIWRGQSPSAAKTMEEEQQQPPRASQTRQYVPRKALGSSFQEPISLLDAVLEQVAN